MVRGGVERVSLKLGRGRKTSVVDDVDDDYDVVVGAKSNFIHSFKSYCWSVPRPDRVSQLADL